MTSVLRFSSPPTSLWNRSGDSAACRISFASTSPRASNTERNAPASSPIGRSARLELPPCFANRSRLRATRSSHSARRTPRLVVSSLCRSSKSRSSTPPQVTRASSKRWEKCTACFACASVGVKTASGLGSSGDTDVDVDASQESSARCTNATSWEAIAGPNAGGRGAAGGWRAANAGGAQGLSLEVPF